MVSNHAIMLTILQKLGYETIQGVDAFRCAWNHRFLDIWEKINSSNFQKILVIMHHLQTRQVLTTFQTIFQTAIQIIVTAAIVSTPITNANFN